MALHHRGRETRELCTQLGEEHEMHAVFASIAAELENKGIFYEDILRNTSNADVDDALTRALGFNQVSGFKHELRVALGINSFPNVAARDEAADEEFVPASPGTILLMAAARERGRPEARAARRAEQQRDQQLKAEADKWAPGSAAVQALAEGFLNPNADARLAQVVSPARMAAPHLHCPAGHALTREVAGRELRCDVPGCRAMIAPDMQRLACEECDYDVCENCLPSCV